jgi:hypothetical protein
VVVHEVACSDDLNHEEPRFRLGEPSSFTKHIHDRL